MEWAGEKENQSRMISERKGKNTSGKQRKGNLCGKWRRR